MHFLFYYFNNNKGILSRLNIKNLGYNLSYAEISISIFSNKIILTIYKENESIYIINYDLNLKDNQLSLIGEIPLTYVKCCTEIKKDYYIALQLNSLYLFHKMENKTMVMLVVTGGGTMLVIFLAMMMMMF